MLKKALKIAISLGVLLSAYVGYVRLFAIVAERAVRSRPQVMPLIPITSRTMKEAIALAAKGFGEGHWSTDRDLQGRYYNKERGYWIYYKDYELLNDGKQLRFRPFALIWQSRDKKDLKTVTSAEAIVDLDRPLGQAVKPGGPALRITHAQITGDVRIRDDKGTVDDGDDMVIGPMPYVEYDEPTLQVRSESDVVIQDRDMWASGFGLLIQLRPKDESDPTASSSNGFNGAKTLYLKKSPHIVLNDVGRAGILPGTAQPEQTASGRTPLDLRSDSEMQINLPRPRIPVRVGPPAPHGPTEVLFSRNVVVLRGKANQTPDQLNCDHLRLILRPAEKPLPAATASAGANPTEVAGTTPTRPEAGTPADPVAPGDSLGGLTLRLAVATGHYVWLQSESQRTKTLGTELIYKKLAPEAPDETYLRGDATSKLWVEKIDVAQEGPDKGKVRGITRIWTVDATIFDEGKGRDSSTIVARGPGRLETRPARDQPVERSAFWQDQLVMQNEPGADKLPRKKITLTGNPRFVDVKQATLDSRNIIVVWLKPKPSATTNAPAIASGAPASAKETSPTTSAPASGSYQIEKLLAQGDVHLNSPGRKMTARDRLDAEFETLAATAPTTTTEAARAAPIAATTTTPDAVAVNSPAATADPSAPASQAATAKAEMKPAEPDVIVRAGRIWARIGLRPSAGQGDDASATLGLAQTRADGSTGTRSEIQQVRLREAVSFHQDPAPGKRRGTDVAGDAVDVTNLGDGKMYFTVFKIDPSKVFPRDRKIKDLQGDRLAQIEAAGKSYPPARVETDEFSVEGPIIGMNQKTDEAWVDGRGRLTQQAPRGLLTDKGIGDPSAQARPQVKTQAQADADANQTPLTIAWKKSMMFRGQSTNPQGLPVARAQFFGDVRAEMEDALLRCQEMTTFMDQVVRLNRANRDGDARPDKGAEAAPSAPKPQIALIDCLRQVVIISQKIDPETRTLLQRQEIDGEHVTYDKLTGKFIVPGPGVVHLYNREGQDSLAHPGGATPPTPGPATTADRRRVTPTANPTAGAATNARRATEVVGRNAGNDGAATAKAKADRPEDAKPLPLKLTLISFNDEMHGRFGTGKDADKSEIRWADFFGDVQVLNGVVPSEKVSFDFDRPPDDGTFLTAQTIRVVSEPPPPGSKEPARNLLKAWENANARTSDTTIQADKITFDSLKELFYAYGENGNNVLINQAKIVGQPVTNASGSTAWYNRKTGESHVENPRSIQFVDGKNAARANNMTSLPEPKRKFKKPLVPNKPPGRSYFERKGFNGR